MDFHSTVMRGKRDMRPRYQVQSERIPPHLSACEGEVSLERFRDKERQEKLTHFDGHGQHQASGGARAMERWNVHDFRGRFHQNRSERLTIPGSQAASEQQRPSQRTRAAHLEASHDIIAEAHEAKRKQRTKEALFKLKLETDAGEVERTMAQALRFAKKNAALVESDVQADKEVAAARDKDLKAAASDLWPKCSTAGEEALLRSVSRGDMVRSSH